MGCSMNKGFYNIKKSTVVEILNEEEYKKDYKNSAMTKCRCNGQVIKIYYRSLGGNKKSIKD